MAHPVMCANKAYLVDTRNALGFWIDSVYYGVRIRREETMGCRPLASGVKATNVYVIGHSFHLTFPVPSSLEKISQMQETISAESGPQGWGERVTE
uniref:Uncharacterized protein n=1 Tax=Pristionchus pacificus TaxID=54126 RepID=A0A2A6CFD2_PRIPA|eukprot:PDM76763.1 hypothetical protein PRIPAC_42158 [Pristionchus pacificus]